MHKNSRLSKLSLLFCLCTNKKAISDEGDSGFAESILGSPHRGGVERIAKLKNGQKKVSCFAAFLILSLRQNLRFCHLPRQREAFEGFYCIRGSPCQRVIPRGTGKCRVAHNVTAAVSGCRAGSETGVKIFVL